MCEFLLTVENGQKIVCTVTLDDDRLTGDAEPGYEILLEKILKESVVGPDGEKYSGKDDPKEWFKALPFQYDGIYLNARIRRLPRLRSSLATVKS